MRTPVRAAGTAAAVLLIAACSGAGSTMSDELKKDLDLAATASPIDLAASQPAMQVVSAVERTTPPAPRRIAQTQRAPRHVPAPRATRAPVEVEAADLSEELEPQPVEVADATVEAPLPSPRPQPVAATGGAIGDGPIGRGGDRGAGIGEIIGVVLRGGHAGIDDCDPRVDGRRGRGGVNTAINNRIPVIGTFPGSGRIQGTFPGRVSSNFPSRSRF